MALRKGVIRRNRSATTDCHPIFVGHKKACHLLLLEAFRKVSPHSPDIYIIYTPKLGFGIAIFDREREHGRFKREH